MDWRAALLAAAIVISYANSLSGPFILDDQAAIVQNPGIRELSRLSDVLATEPDSPVAGRPLVSLSFALNYAAGGLDVRGYHVWNITMHLVCALLAYGLIRRTLDLPRVSQRVGHSSGIAFACALLWAVHPLNSEVVNYLSQRTESMMGAFYLLTIYAAARSATARRPMAWQAVAIVACAFGVLCKESIATAPLVVALYDRVFLYRSMRESVSSRRTLYLGLAMSWIVLAGVLGSSPRGSVAGFSSGVPMWTYLLNQSKMIVEYLRLAVWPDSLVAYYGWPRALTLADVLPQAVFVVALLAATVAALVRVPLAAFPAAWFFITLAPASSVVPIATEVGAERRMYLPLLGLVALAVIGVRAVSNAVGGFSLPPPRAAALMKAALLLAVAGALAAATVVRNGEYSSALTLTRTIVERRPSGVAHHMFAEQLLSAGREEEAVAHLREAVAAGNSRAGFPLGVALFNQGHADESIERLDAFVKTAGVRLVPRWLEPPGDEVLKARTVIGLAFLQKREWARAAEQAEATLSVVPAYPEARAVLAHARFGQERWADAVREYRAYLAARPDDVQALLDFGVALVATDNLGEALPVFRRAVEIDPLNASARRLLRMAEEDSRR